MRYANPVCIVRCAVEVVHVEDAPELTTLTATQGGTGGAVTKSKTTTETEVVD